MCGEGDTDILLLEALLLLCSFLSLFSCPFLLSFCVARMVLVFKRLRYGCIQVHEIGGFGVCEALASVLFV